MIFLQLDQAPGALKTLMEQNALFALMAVIIVVLARISWTFLNKHLKRLEEDGKVKEQLEKMREENRDEFRKLNDRLK